MSWSWETASVLASIFVPVASLVLGVIFGLPRFLDWLEDRSARGKSLVLVASAERVSDCGRLWLRIDNPSSRRVTVTKFDLTFEGNFGTFGMPNASMKTSASPDPDLYVPLIIQSGGTAEGEMWFHPTDNEWRALKEKARGKMTAWAYDDRGEVAECEIFWWRDPTWLLPEEPSREHEV